MIDRVLDPNKASDRRDAWLILSGMLDDDFADLHGAYLRDADLRGTDFHSANLRGADLRGANFHSANLRGADLGGADLSGTYFENADLHNANLRGTDLGGAYVESCPAIWRVSGFTGSIEWRSLAANMRRTASGEWYAHVYVEFFDGSIDDLVAQYGNDGRYRFYLGAMRDFEAYWKKKLGEG